MDIDRGEPGALDGLGALGPLLAIDARERSRIERDSGRARVYTAQDRIHLILESLEDGPDGDRMDRRELDLFVGPNIVVSVHDGPAAAIDRFVASFDGETHLGALSAADLLSSLVDEVIVGYFDLVERIERDIDALDQRALRGRPGDDLLAALVATRRRISLVRRTLAPHRGALAALARPELQIEDQVGRPWPALVDRVEIAMDAVEGLRDALIGTYDIHMGRVAQHANDVMRVMTLLSAVLLPAVVLAGVMGMNFQVPIFEAPGNFYLVIVAMAGLAVGILLIARWRRWM